MEERGLELGIWDLPAECISHIFSLTSPRDACRCSAVSSKFCLAAKSDAAWERFLPSNWEDTILRSVSPSFALEKISGKISYMLGPEDLLQLRGRIQAQLSTNTAYAAYLVYVPRFAGIEYPPLKVSVRFVGEGVEIEVDEVGTNAYLLTTIFTPEDDGYSYWNRSDKWMEIEMGEFFIGQDDVHEVEMRLWEIGEYDVIQASGLDVQGIEIRPKRGQNE
ncbi:hypothetical protein FNV43_RR02302 [Rhamnella rubrinervis]|uniref:F-box domain-containing protein n=1 Tax=Rhamnella rubrinervis TaxID=2594499 RepID=A0A8K0HSF7_9ROSA|nr:hypothetical protein FNV43_RR02302 [Rhamnella rubrinervis]